VGLVREITGMNILNIVSDGGFDWIGDPPVNFAEFGVNGTVFYLL